MTNAEPQIADTTEILSIADAERLRDAAFSHLGVMLAGGYPAKSIQRNIAADGAKWTAKEAQAELLIARARNGMFGFPDEKNRMKELLEGGASGAELDPELVERIINVISSQCSERIASLNFSTLSVPLPDKEGGNT